MGLETTTTPWTVRLALVVLFLVAADCILRPLPPLVVEDFSQDGDAFLTYDPETRDLLLYPVASFLSETDRKAVDVVDGQLEDAPQRQNLMSRVKAKDAVVKGEADVAYGAVSTTGAEMGTAADFLDANGVPLLSAPYYLAPS